MAYHDGGLKSALFNRKWLAQQKTNLLWNGIKLMKSVRSGLNVDMLTDGQKHYE